MSPREAIAASHALRGRAEFIRVDAVGRVRNHSIDPALLDEISRRLVDAFLEPVFGVLDRAHEDVRQYEIAAATARLFELDGTGDDVQATGTPNGVGFHDD